MGKLNTQIVGSTDELHKFDNETFDMIICHNVLEYAEDREDIVKEFARILKPKDIVLGTHGTALSTILNFYDNSFGCEDFLRIIDWMPYIIELDFESDKVVSKQEHCHVEKEFKGKQRADNK